MKKLLVGSLIASSFAILSGCGADGRVTGGGTMHSAGGDGKTVFTINASRCPDSTGESVVKGQVQFHDKTAIDFEDTGGVSLHADVISAMYCSGDPADDNGEYCLQCQAEGYYEVEFAYSSQNSQNPGEGNGYMCIADAGSGNGLHGIAIVQVTSGPYDGYSNLGGVSGNVQAHECNTQE